MTGRMTELLETETPIRGRLIRPTDAGYEDARQVWNGAIDRRPALIVRCREGADAEWALRHARQNAVTAHASEMSTVIHELQSRPNQDKLPVQDLSNTSLT